MQLGSDDLEKMSNFGFLSLKTRTNGFSSGFGLENFINGTRYLYLTPFGGPLVRVCMG
jgi:hypothetical protein